MSVYCEGKLNVLNDTVLRPTIFDGTTESVFSAFLAAHNAQVSDSQRLLPGSVTVTGNPYRDFDNYETTYSRVQDLVESYGGYLYMRYESDGDYLDWVDDFSTEATQEINLKENVLNLSSQIISDDLYTAVLPLGTRLLDENGSETNARLTIESTQGVDYIFDESAVALS